ncbi:putative ABC transporter ATP-binding protein YhaQ [Paenibacillus sp. CCS19]|uniref:ABC transporter ATP-binding protein n=1 Tax=Paenibacillus sp. CCS19 TaxID=3158387 RepID=UPI00255FE426|nr:ATP-binding cassette domain-containing protein [Paenibacillus cellulosilyticus]GMK40943.1 putative ABC transporter ATP-binding protein YhaQ [Paenibacillus cellulosilyticus]
MNPLVVERIVKNYGEKTAVNGLSLQVAEGEIYGLLGANGAGKTTTMRMVLGLIYPDEGSILYNGKAYSKEQLHNLGYLPEERGLYPKVRVDEQLLYLAQLRGMTKKAAEDSLKKWLEQFEVAEYYGKRIEELSKGNQQKIGFIAAVIHDPQILILDEAFSGLDPVNVELLKAAVKGLRDSGKTILFSTHRMEHVEELCRNITIMHRSNPVVQGDVKAVKKQYPRERVMLATDREVTGLETLAGVRYVTRHENVTEIGIASEDTAKRILHHAQGQAEIERFELMQPTLNEIFIKTVGERNE